MKHKSNKIQTLKTNIEYYTNLVDLLLEDRNVKKFFLDYIIKKQQSYIYSFDEIFLQLLNSKEKQDEFADLIEVIKEMKSKEYRAWNLKAQIVHLYIEDIISSYKDNAINFLMENSDPCI